MEGYKEMAISGAERVIRDVMDDIIERLETIYNRTKLDAYDKRDLQEELRELLEDMTK